MINNVPLLKGNTKVGPGKCVGIFSEKNQNAKGGDLESKGCLFFSQIRRLEAGGHGTVILTKKQLDDINFVSVEKNVEEVLLDEYKNGCTTTSATSTRNANGKRREQILKQAASSEESISKIENLLKKSMIPGTLEKTNLDSTTKKP